MIKVNELIALIDKLEEVEPRDNDDFKHWMMKNLAVIIIMPHM